MEEPTPQQQHIQFLLYSNEALRKLIDETYAELETYLTSRHTMSETNQHIYLSQIKNKLNTNK
tara:strand:- start:233 stop:421 length:189 start_codon:yes stop_codon:yes gene_type:complete